MAIEWYPGHMTAAMRRMEKDLPLVDLVIELLDARIPISSKNPKLDSLVKGKKKIIVLNKADLADPKLTEEWVKVLKKKYEFVIPMDSRSKKGMAEVKKAAGIVLQEKRERDKKKGIAARPIKTMIAGIPNVGKSTFINSFVGKVAAKTGNKPGVTRGNQWIRISQDLNLLDTPGVLWPKFDNQAVGYKLASYGAIADHVFDEGDVAFTAIGYMKKYYCNALSERYKIENVSEMDNLAILTQIGINKKLLKKGAEVDFSRASHMLLEDLRSGRLGRISLDDPFEQED